jgi:hypothetical protein
MQAASFRCVVATNSLKLIGSTPNERRIPSRHYNLKGLDIAVHPDAYDGVWHLARGTGHTRTCHLPPLH